MTDDQELIAEAVARVVELRAVYPVEMGPLGGDHGLIEDLTTALSAAAVRYRAEGWDQGYEAAARFHEGSRKGHWEDDQPRKGLRQWIADPAPANPYRALLAENNETQEG